MTKSTVLVLESDEPRRAPLCPRCEEDEEIDLDLHQPDLQQPDRILGICPCCGAWYLLVCGRIDVATLWRDWPYGT